MLLGVILVDLDQETLWLPLYLVGVPLGRSDSMGVSS